MASTLRCIVIEAFLALVSGRTIWRRTGFLTLFFLSVMQSAQICLYHMGNVASASSVNWRYRLNRSANFCVRRKGVLKRGAHIDRRSGPSADLNATRTCPVSYALLASLVSVTCSWVILNNCGQLDLMSGACGLNLSPKADTRRVRRSRSP